MSGPAALVLALTAAGALAVAPSAPRTPDQRQALADLAYVLGEAHALRRLCLGPADAVWYDRMQRLLMIEAPEPSFRAKLASGFNAGFLAAQAEHSACSDASRAAERAAAERGRALSNSLAGADLRP
jgi:uncharacterized protein (TIGR02301 family)